jgi:hypothetical protein
VGALIISNDMHGLKGVMGGFGKVMSGPKWGKKGLFGSARAALPADQADEDQRRRRA